jgi:SAM-dependent methyltransferase
MTQMIAALALVLALSPSALGRQAATTPTERSPEQERATWNMTFLMGAPTLKREPSSVLVATVLGRQPGKALDLGTGEGRNAVFLAEQQWEVTGVDISDVAVAQAKTNAAARKVKLEAIVGNLDTYDFGSGQWDLITSFYMQGWHGRSKTDVPARIYQALKPGGLVVIEGFAKPEVSVGFSTDALSSAYARLRILRNESVIDEADWDIERCRPCKSHIVRFVAEKPK